MLSRAEIDTLQANLHRLTPEEQAQMLEVLEEIERREFAARAQEDFLSFCVAMDPNYKVGAHHKRLAALLMDMVHGEKDRIGVSIAPRHGKSHMISTLFPAWLLGKFPDKMVMLVSHTADLAVDFGRKVRNLIASDRYRQIFPTVRLSVDSKSAGRWNTNVGGGFYATGVGSALAGRGADFLIIDDPHSEQAILAGDYEQFDKAYDWFTTGARTRLMKGGKIAVVHCMTGDTGVMLPDGTEKPLRDVRPGDEIATYSEGKFTTARVLNWANQGLDCVYAIHMTSGRIVRANERHPFLVSDQGELKWVKVKNLKPNMTVVSVGRASGQGLPAPMKGAMPLSTHGTSVSATTTPSGGLLAAQKTKGIGAKIADVLVALTAVITRPRSKGCAPAITTSSDTVRGVKNAAPRKIGTRTSCIGTELASRITTDYGPNKTVDALSVASRPDHITPRPTGKVSSLSITAMTQPESGRSCATPATSSWGTEPQWTPSNGRLSTYEPTLDQIAKIVPDGVEDVFDIQVEGTENFIANGLVSHNTRWHPNDLIGRLAADMARSDEVDQYEFFEFPAILYENTDDEKALWPEFFPLEALKRTRASMPLFQWNAQYQQNPTGEQGAIVPRDSWRVWTEPDPPQVDYIIMAVDAAAESHNRADFSAIAVWGVFRHERITDGEYHIILLQVRNERVQFPELKLMVLNEYKTWQPDAFIVEKKSNGTPLYHEMRRMGIPVQEFNPSRATGDKVMRLNAVSDIFHSGMVWYPAGRKWAEELVEQVASFPASANDDMVDVTSMSLARFRAGGFIRLPTDAREDDEPRRPRSRAYY